MPDLFGLDIAGIVADALTSAGGLAAATLVKIYPGSRVPGALTGGVNPTSTSYTTTGILETRAERDWAGSGWTMTERKKATITLVGKPLTDAGVTPEAGDRVTLEAVTYEIITVDRDPAAATYSLTVAVV